MKSFSRRRRAEGSLTNADYKRNQNDYLAWLYFITLLTSIDLEPFNDQVQDTFYLQLIITFISTFVTLRRTDISHLTTYTFNIIYIVSLKY